MTGDEFKVWLRAHQARHPRSDWPTSDAAITFFGEWLSAFRAASVTPEEAEEASSYLARQPDVFLADHLGRMLGRIWARRRDRAVAESVERRRSEREAVEAEKATEADLRARWRSLPRPERRRRIGRVKAENPGLARWPLWILRLAMAAPEPRTPTRPEPEIAR